MYWILVVTEDNSLTTSSCISWNSFLILVTFQFLLKRLTSKVIPIKHLLNNLSEWILFRLSKFIKLRHYKFLRVDLSRNKFDKTLPVRKLLVNMNVLRFINLTISVFIKILKFLMRIKLNNFYYNRVQHTQLCYSNNEG